MKLELSENSRSGLFCAPSVLKSFGITNVPNTSMYAFQIKQYFQRGGYMINDSKAASYIQDLLTGTHWSRRKRTQYYPTMSAFIRFMYENGTMSKYDVVFFSRGHVMCVKDGLLTDTAKMHGRARVRSYFLVEKKLP